MYRRLVLPLLLLSALPNLTDFAALPADPAPPELVRGQHYWVSNEDRPDLFKADLEALGGGGVYVGVGTDQNYMFAAWAKPEVAVMMDFDETVAMVHSVYREVFSAAETRQQFMKMWTKAGFAPVRAKLLAAAKNDVEKDVYKRARILIEPRLAKVEAAMRKRKVKCFLTDDEQYKFIRDLVLAGKVVAVRGDLTVSGTMQAIAAAAKKANLPMRVLYLSNAEQYVEYKDAFTMNMMALPWDEKGVVIRTMSWKIFGFAPDSNYYHYNVQTGRSFQEWLKKPETKSVATILKAAEKTGPGTSRMMRGPEEPARPSEPASAPDALPCLEKGPAGMSCIPGGSFLRGTNSGDRNARPQASVFVQSFYMDQYEVTYGDYQACVAEGKCNKAGPKYRDFDNPKQPITGVSWYDAKKYCETRGKRLPTEAQWEKAARGTDGRRYPWGDSTATCEKAVYMNEKGRSCGIPQKSKSSPEKGRPDPVGTRPPNEYGLYDMAGNSWEWVNDWYSPSYKACGAACEGVDPLGPCGGKDVCPGHSEKIVRGGSWYWPDKYMTTYHRRPHVPANKPIFHHFGFRCAASLEEAKALAK